MYKATLQVVSEESCKKVLENVDSTTKPNFRDRERSSLVFAGKSISDGTHPDKRGVSRDSFHLFFMLIKRALKRVPSRGY